MLYVLLEIASMKLLFKAQKLRRDLLREIIENDDSDEWDVMTDEMINNCKESMDAWTEERLKKTDEMFEELKGQLYEALNESRK